MSDTHLDGCLNYVYWLAVPVTIYGHNKMYFTFSGRIHLDMVID